MPESKFTQTVTDEVWLVVAGATSNAFADSYLYGAVVQDGQLEPRTQIGFDALRREKGAVEGLKRLGITLRKPAPWKDGNGKLTAAECFGMASDAPMRKRRAA